MKEFPIGTNEEGIRLDKQLKKILNNASSGFIYKMLRKKNITLNDKKAAGDEHLKSGDIIKIYLSDETFDRFSARETGDDIPDVSMAGDLSGLIIYEDDDVIFLNKPAGLLSQKASKDDISVNELCISYLKDKGELNDDKLKVFKPSVCNRLDRNTSGLIIFAKNYRTAAAFSRSLKERLIQKYYLCIVSGRIDKAGEGSAYLNKDERTNRVTVRDKGKENDHEIRTAYKPLYTNGEYSLLLIDLITGKPHQIRAQMAAMGHPLLGDYKYGNRKLNDAIKNKFGLKAQLLHAYRLVIPGDNEDLKDLAGTYTAPPPDNMDKIISGLLKRDLKSLTGE